MDQMAGLNSDASRANSINNFDDYALVFLKFNANIFTNIYSCVENRSIDLKTVKL